MNIKHHDIHSGTSPELTERAKIFRKTPTLKFHFTLACLEIL